MSLQVVHLDKDEEMQKLPLQPPYYDMAPSESTPFTDIMVRKSPTSPSLSPYIPPSHASSLKSLLLETLSSHCMTEDGTSGSST
jgi:hypothetical protein